jgi:hypothetical protein
MIQVISQASTLYELDFLLWTEETSNKLKARDFDCVDWENLIEEIEDLGRSQKRELKNRLRALLEHLLKRIYVPMPQEFNGWECTIREQRVQIELELEDSPSLKTIWDESFEQAWRFALKLVRDEYINFDFPNTWQFDRDMDAMLSVKFWEIS